MDIQTLLKYKQEAKDIIKEITSGSYPGNGEQDFMNVESLIRLQLWKLAQRKPDGKKLANEIVHELGLERSFNIKPRK